MHAVNIFAFSLVLGRSNSNNTLFQIVLGFFGTPCRVQLRAPVFIAIYKRYLHIFPLKMFHGTDNIAFFQNVPVLEQRFEMKYVPDISYPDQALR